MEPLACFPDPFPAGLSRELNMFGIKWVSFSTAKEALESADKPVDGWSGAIVSTVVDHESGWSICRSLRVSDDPISPIVVVVSADRIREVEMRDELFDEFIVFPFTDGELGIRLGHIFWKEGKNRSPDLLSSGPLLVNTDTYQALLDGKPMDLTFMEYELLKFFVLNQGKVFTRHALLSRVWGYEYYGGARTVDVHVRRLRAKLGEEHAGLIQTVRSVGYRFGLNRWDKS